MNFNALSFILSLGAFQGFFMGFLLLRLKTRNAAPNRILAALLVDLSLLLILIIFVEAGYQNLGLIRLILTPLLFMMGPCLYFYLRQYTNPSACFSMNDAMNIVPAALVVIYYLPKYFLSGWMPFLNYRFMTFFFWHIFIVHFLTYLLLSIIMIRKPADLKKENPAEPESVHFWVAFLFKFFVGAFVAMVAVTTYDMTRLFIGFKGIRLTESALALFGVFMICSVSFKGLMHPEIFFGKPENVKGGGTGKTMPQKKAKEIMSRLTHIMEKEKPYLNPDFTLPELAVMTGFPRSDLSTVINANNGQNFYDYINEYRVNSAKKLLHGNADMNMVEIAYNSGFNSKSTFNDAFKRNTGLTPSEYKIKTSVK